jgi:hypothetical protein
VYNFDLMEAKVNGFANLCYFDAHAQNGRVLEGYYATSLRVQFNAQMFYTG